MTQRKSLFEKMGLSFPNRLKLKPSRRFMVDYLYFTKQVPSQPIWRNCDVQNIVALRKKIPQRIGWAAIMLKAIAHLSEKQPELRCSYMKWPWGHLYLHPHQIAYIAVSRVVEDEKLLIFHRIEKPEEHSLIQIQESIEQAQSQPLENNRLFQFRRKFCRLPWFIRRVIWWLALSLSGKVRTSMTGTMGVTSVALCGATSITPPTLGNLVVTYGPVQPDGTMRITFVYDHRVHDGITVAENMQKFEAILNDVIAEELQALSERPTPSIGKYFRVPLPQVRETESSSKKDAFNIKQRQTKLE